MLGGFVIKRFMGLWTLVIKSLGLVGKSSVTVYRLKLIIAPVSFGCLWYVARERRSSRSRCLLLRESNNETVRKPES